MYSKIQSAELWLLDSIFQKFSDLTYRFLRLSNFAWAIASLTVCAFSMIQVSYRGLMHEKDPFMVFPILIAILVFFPSSIYSLKKAWYAGYDDAIYGLESSLKHEQSRLRTEALLFTIGVTMIWAVIAMKNKSIGIGTLILWTSMIQYPVYAFSACTPPCKKI